MSQLFNKIFESGEYPESWGNGIIVPIFKGGNKNEQQNYRGITLINILAKIYSTLLSNRLSKWVKKNKVVIENQYGFQKGKSTNDCIFILHTLIAKTLSQKKKLYVAFLDWEKMFDNIDRSFLWQKLLTLKCSTKMISVRHKIYVQNYKTNSTFQIRNFKSNTFICWFKTR